MYVKAVKTKIYKEHDDLFEFITKHVKKLPEQSVLVVTSKIVALAEGRTVPESSKAAKIRLIKEESDFAIKTKWVWLTIKDGFVMATAGIDESNADGKLILLPEDSFKTAQKLRNRLKKHYKIKEFGVLITDSRTAPLRKGVTGVALGYAGFKGLKDYKGTKDIFGKIFKFASVNIADSLATAAVLVMGEGAERHPLAVITKAPITFSDRIRKEELKIDIKEDMYAPLFKTASRKK